MTTLHVIQRMKNLIYIASLFFLAQLSSADALLLQHCRTKDGNTYQYGEIKKEIKALRTSQIILKDHPLSSLLSLYAGKEGSPTAILYLYDEKVPTVSLEMKDASYLEILEEACSQLDYVFWVENYVIHMMPRSKLTEHKNPNLRIRSVKLKEAK